MKRALRNFILLLAAYLLFAIPFKAMNLIPGFTNVRPVSAFSTIYGVFYGPVGCLAYACGNLVSDILDNALRWSSLAGFAANFLGPCTIWFLWKRYGRHPFALRTIPDLLFHTLVIVLAAFLQDAIITSSVAYAYPDVNATLFACIVLGNEVIFPIMLGIPMAIVLQEEFGVTPYQEKNIISPTDLHF